MDGLGRTVERDRTVAFRNCIIVYIFQVLATTMDESLEMELAVADGGVTANVVKEDDCATIEKYCHVRIIAPTILNPKVVPNAKATPNVKAKLTSEDFDGVSLSDLKI